MEYVVKFLSVDGEHRAVVSYDMHPDNPRECGWQEQVSVWNIVNNCAYNQIPEGESPLNPLFDSVQDEMNDRDLTKDVAELILSLKGWQFVTTSIYAGRDWVADTIWYANGQDVSGDVVRSAINEYQKYANGEVYVVELQKKVVYRSDDGRELIQWETFESSAGFYDGKFSDIQDFCSDFNIVLDDTEVM